MTTNRFVALTFAALLYTSFVRNAGADTFGSGANTFDIEFVSIGNPGNPGDRTGNPRPVVGSVPYAYRIGKFEISEQMIDKANAEGGLSITKDTRGPDKPVTSMSWFEAATFVNWLNMSKSHTPAYKFNGSNFELWQAGDAGYDPNNPFRNSQARYFLPGAHEWYKAAYYDPTSGVYFDYPTGSDSIPDGIDFAGDTTFDAVFHDGGSNPNPNDITDVGVLSPYGTAGQGGNVWEWEETELDLMNDSSSSVRGVRGGVWSASFLGGYLCLNSTCRLGGFPANQDINVGFRVASNIPEPSTMLLLCFGSLAIYGQRRNLRLDYCNATINPSPAATSVVTISRVRRVKRQRSQGAIAKTALNAIGIRYGSLTTGRSSSKCHHFNESNVKLLPLK